MRPCPAEKEIVMSERWSDVLIRHPDLFQNNSIIGLFRLAADYRPDQTAVVDEKSRLTYRELELKSNQAARGLSEAGAQPGEIIAVRTGRSAEAVIACLGIWKIGCACLFVDSECPEYRNRECMEECQVRITADCDFIRRALDCQPDAAVDEVGDRDRLAVIVYTSGSCGKPKGVQLSQANVAASAANFPEIGFNSDDRYCCFANLMFVAAVYDISTALSIGATLYLIPGGIRRNIREIAGYYREHGITVTFLPPHMAMKYIAIDQESPLRILLSGSEPVRNLDRRPYELINVYASSEACALISYYRIRDSRKWYPIGRVVSGLRYYIVDEEGKQAAENETGELWISGPQVTRGYRNMPELNSERFCPNPFCREAPWERVFKTGDMVKLGGDGELIYCGRRDNMVKIRGFRVELAGVEQCIIRYPGIREVCCIAHRDSGGTNLLFCYYCSDQEIDHGKLRQYLKDYLPYYMIPSALIRCAGFPRTLSGKVDRRAFIPPPELDDHKRIEELYR